VIRITLQEGIASCSSRVTHSRLLIGGSAMRHISLESRNYRMVQCSPIIPGRRCGAILRHDIGVIRNAVFQIRYRTDVYLSASVVRKRRRVSVFAQELTVA